MVFKKLAFRVENSVLPIRAVRKSDFQTERKRNSAQPCSRFHFIRFPVFQSILDSDSLIDSNRFCGKRFRFDSSIPLFDSRFQSILLWNRFRNRNRKIGIGSTLVEKATLTVTLIPLEYYCIYIEF